MALCRTAVTAALALFLLALIALVVRRWRHIAIPETRLLFAMTAAAPPIGLLLLGFAFDNAPIELRYLAFATPYIGLLLAAALPRHIRHAVLAIQAIALLGLMTRAETMQPARATAIAAAHSSATASCCCRAAMTGSASSAPSPSKRRRRCACW